MNKEDQEFIEDVMEYNIRHDEDFREQAIDACMEIGLTEDEAEMAVDDYLY